jgi:hypothetical protein
MIRIRSQIFFYCGIESGEPSQFFSQKEFNEERWLAYNPLLVKAYTKFGSILELHYNIHSPASLNPDKLNNVSPYQ